VKLVRTQINIAKSQEVTFPRSDTGFVFVNFDFHRDETDELASDALSEALEEAIRDEEGTEED